MDNKKILYIALALVGGIVVGYMTGGSKISVQDQGAATLSSKVAQESLNNSTTESDVFKSIDKQLEDKILAENNKRLKDMDFKISYDSVNIKKAQEQVKANRTSTSSAINPSIYAPFPNLITVTDNVNTVDYHVLLNINSGTSSFTFIPIFFGRSDIPMNNIPFKRLSNSAAKYSTSTRIRSLAGWGPYFNSLAISSNITVNSSNNNLTVPANQIGTIEFTYSLPKNEFFSGIHSFKINNLFDAFQSNSYLTVQNVPELFMYANGINDTPIFTSLQTNMFFTPLILSLNNSLYGSGFGNINEVTISYFNGCTASSIPTIVSGKNDGILQRIELGNLVTLSQGQLCELGISFKNIDTGKVKFLNVIVLGQ
ncbi:MAG TPA: hypothetical protein PK886_02090 [Candidatus Paceibacterota bacterium]|nr:hypothetical protein [Candidatus Paceibacterota bacterium]